LPSCTFREPSGAADCRLAYIAPVAHVFLVIFGFINGDFHLSAFKPFYGFFCYGRRHV